MKLLILIILHFLMFYYFKGIFLAIFRHVLVLKHIFTHNTI